METQLHKKHTYIYVYRYVLSVFGREYDLSKRAGGSFPSPGGVGSNALHRNREASEREVNSLAWHIILVKPPKSLSRPVS
jgi:hypothetical protein